MKTTDIRVRPVIRHVVTRFTSEPETGSGSSECVAEFNHESYAEEVAQALKDKAAPREYAIVQETVGDVIAEVFYAYSQAEVDRVLAEPRMQGKGYRVFSRIREPVSLG
jgi:hypothetical protein